MRVDPGTVIALASCNHCGRDVLIKTNKNGIAYYYCNGQAVAGGEGCSHHEKWGRAASQEKIRAYYAAQQQAPEPKEEDHAEDPGQQEAGNQTGAGDTAGSDDSRGKRRGGLAGIFGGGGGSVFDD